MRLIEGKKYKILPCACGKCNEDPFLNAMNDRLGRKVPASIILCLYVGHRSRLFLVQNVSRVCVFERAVIKEPSEEGTRAQDNDAHRKEITTPRICARVYAMIWVKPRAHTSCVHIHLFPTCVFFLILKANIHICDMCARIYSVEER